MTLIIGGAYSGKTDFALRKYSLNQSEIIDGSYCAEDKIYSCRAIKNFHLFVKNYGIESGIKLAERIYLLNPGIVIISNEIGSGIIPMEKRDRLWREETGRACCVIAKHSESVIRMCCGIPVFLKGEQDGD